RDSRSRHCGLAARTSDQLPPGRGTACRACAASPLRQIRSEQNLCGPNHRPVDEQRFKRLLRKSALDYFPFPRQSPRMSLSDDISASSPKVESHFQTTHWSVVLSASQKDSAHGAEALEELCRAYWYPLYC